MNKWESKDHKVEFSQGEFYWFSRRRHWKVCDYLRLIFNNKILEYPLPGTPEYRYLKLIVSAINVGDKLKLIDTTPSSPEYKFLRPFATPIVEMPKHERGYYTELLSARQAFNFAFLHHLMKVWQASPKEYKIPDIFPILMNSDHAVMVSPGFLGMQEEIAGSELKDFAKTTPVWTGLDIVQIFFGPRYKDEKNLKLDPVASFIRLAEVHIQTGNLFPLKSSPSREFLKATFKPVELVCFIYREDVFQWLKRQGVDILEWVSEMFDREWVSEIFDRIEGEDDSGMPVASTEQPTKKRDDNFGTADPDGIIQKAIKKLKAKGVRKNVVPYRPEIYKAMTGDKGFITREDNYKEESGHALSTIKAMTHKIYKN